MAMMSAVPSLSLLSEESVIAIHDAALDVLANTGVLFTEPAAIPYLKEAGCRVDDEGLTKFPREVVEEALLKVPRQFQRLGTDETQVVQMGTGAAHFGVGSLPLYTLDLHTGQRREATRQDMVNFARISDTLDNFDIANNCVQCLQIPESVVHAVWLQILYENAGKPFCCWYAKSQQVAEETIEVASAASGGLDELKRRKTIAITTCPNSGLSWGDGLWGLIEFAKVELPIEIMPMPFSGSSHPVTLAGTLVETHADILSAIVLAQTVHPGAPVIYAPYPAALDMLVANPAFGSPETALLGAGAIQLARYCQIPNNAVMGTADSKVPDGQAAYEKMMTILLPALAGADTLSLVGGMVDFALTASYEQLVIDDEICGNIRRLVQGIEVNEATVAADIIHAVGPGGNYLPTEHTLEYFRQEIYTARLADRQRYDAWAAAGAQDIAARAGQKAQEILAQPAKQYLDDKCRQALDEAVARIYQRHNERKEG